MEFLYVLDFLSTLKNIDPYKSVVYVVMFDKASNIQIAGELLKFHYPKFSVMRGVEHTVSLFFKDFSKTPVVNHMITAHKAIYNLFGSGIYQKPNSIFKSKSYEFHNGDIGLFSGNDTRIAGYLIGIHRYLRMRKELPAIFSSAEFNTLSLNSKHSKIVSYIQDNKYWDRIYVLLKILFLVFGFFVFQIAKNQEWTRYSTIP